MNENILIDLGLSKNEAKVYLSLVELGLSTVTQISEKSKVHRTNVYDAIERLIGKGVVSYILKDNVKYFEANDPENLLALLKEKEANLKKILPTLILNRKLSKQTEVQVSEGVAAARNALMGFLKFKEPILIFGVPKDAPETLGDFFLERFQRERIELKVKERLIYNYDAAARVSQLKKLKLCEVKVLPKELTSPMSINVCGDEVFFELFTRSPCLTITIKCQEVAELYKKYFEVMWKVAKKL